MSGNLDCYKKEDHTRQCQNILPYLLQQPMISNLPKIPNTFTNNYRLTLTRRVPFRSTRVHSPALKGYVLLDLLFSVQCFVDGCLSFFFWPLYCLSFLDIRIWSIKNSLRDISSEAAIGYLSMSSYHGVTNKYRFT